MYANVRQCTPNGSRKHTTVPYRLRHRRLAVTVQRCVAAASGDRVTSHMAPGGLARPARYPLAVGTRPSDLTGTGPIGGVMGCGQDQRGPMACGPGSRHYRTDYTSDGRHGRSGLLIHAHSPLWSAPPLLGIQF